MLHPHFLYQWQTLRWRQDLRFLRARLFGVRGSLPDFLGIGAQKSGTTTLHQLLEMHPRVFVPPRKELHYFTMHSHRSMGWYASCFEGASPGQRVGEITPYYLYHAPAAERIAAQLPKVRIIVMLRDPVSRAISHYFHSVRLGVETLPINDAFESERLRLSGSADPMALPVPGSFSHLHHSYLDRSRYEVQLSRWLAMFPRSQFLIMRSEEMFEAPAHAWNRIQSFLDVPCFDLPDLSIRANAGRNEHARIDVKFKSMLRDQLHSTYTSMDREYGISWT
ncbi:MAG: sulfotransferase domain-containing protein [Pirellulaceae bacterium]